MARPKKIQAESASLESSVDLNQNDKLGSPELVAMVRDVAAYAEPHTASVHPDEVLNYASGGWVRAD